MIVCPLYHGRGQKKSALPERGAEKHSDFTVLLERAFEPFPEGNDPGPGQKVVDQQRCDDANGGVEDAVESVAHIGLNGGAEQNDAEHHAAGLDAARPEILAQQDEDNGCKAQQHGQKNAVSALRVEQQVDPEHHDGQQAADESAEESVAAVFDGILHIDAHAEDDADAGESRVAADETVHDGHQHGTDGGLDGAPAHMEPEIFARELWHRSVSSSRLLAVSLLTLLA